MQISYLVESLYQDDGQDDRQDDKQGNRAKRKKRANKTGLSSFFFGRLDLRQDESS